MPTPEEEPLFFANLAVWAVSKDTVLCMRWLWLQTL